MLVDTIVYDTLSRLSGKKICVFGTEPRTEHCIQHIREHHKDITIQFVFTFGKTGEFCALPAYNIGSYKKHHDLSGRIVLLALEDSRKALGAFINHEPAEIYICSREVETLFADNAPSMLLDEKIVPFIMESTTPKIPLLITEAALSEKGKKHHYFIADFMEQKYHIYSHDNVHIPISLREYSAQVEQPNLPMRMSHLGYLEWKRQTHVAQLSHSRRFLAAQRYNFFHLDIIDRENNKLILWHDRPKSDGLWDYMATCDLDDVEEAIYFVRWPLEQAIRGMADGSNKIHCEVGKLNLDTRQAQILADFDFVDRIHQLTISGDKRYMVFAPMRVLKTPVHPSLIKEEELMRKLQEWTVLDSMATLDLHTGKTTYTEIPYPIPAHFELDPLDPHVFYVSTHSLLPHNEGVLIFNPGTIHRLRIVDGTSVIEKTYTHPGFVRTTIHCPFVHRGRVLVAATNQNKVEIIDAESMSAWRIFRLCDDPIYDNADFSDPEFLKKPYSLPALPAHCGAISASADGEYLVLRHKAQYLLYHVAEDRLAGAVNMLPGFSITTHTRHYMQNALQPVALKRYRELWPGAV